MKLPTLAIVALLSLPTIAHAETLTLTSGTWTLGQFEVVDGPTLHAEGCCGQLFFPSCFFCAPGEVLTAGYAEDHFQGSVTVNGSTHPTGVSSVDAAFFSLGFFLTLPPLPLVVPQGTTIVEAPFTILGLLLKPIDGGVERFEITGTGQAQVLFTAEDEAWRRGAFTFSLDTPAAVHTPEPASLLLLGTGLLAVRRRAAARVSSR